MGSRNLVVKPSDLKYRYPRNVARREEPKYAGKPDPAPFDRNDLYEVLPVLQAAMNELGTDDGRVLHLMEDLLNRDMPRAVATREEAFDFLVGCAREVIGT